MVAFIFGLISASPAADGKKTRCAAASVARARRKPRAALPPRVWRERKKKSGDERERREEEGLTLTPSGFLFSRLLAAVERDQDDGDRENGKKKISGRRLESGHRSKKCTVSTGRTSVRNRWGSGRVEHPHSP